MLTNFQRQKLRYIFKAVDYNNDGLACFNDHQQHTMDYVSALISKIPKSDTDKRDFLTKKFLSLSNDFWKKIMESLGVSRSRPITEKEFLNAFVTMMSNSCFLSQYLWVYIESIWFALYLDKSDCISYQDFIHISFFYENQKTREVFDLLDTEKKKKLYIYELYNYWLNFFYSNNQSCPSKYLFGKVDY